MKQETFEPTVITVPEKLREEGVTVQDSLEWLEYFKKNIADDEITKEISDRIYKIQQGKKGEQKVLERLQLCNLPLSLLPDILLKKNDSMVQYDFIVMLQGILYALEVKNWNGEVVVKRSGHVAIRNKSGELQNVDSPLEQNESQYVLLKRILNSEDDFKEYVDYIMVERLVVIANCHEINFETGYPKRMQNIISIEQLRNFLTMEYERKKAADKRRIAEEKKKFRILPYSAKKDKGIWTQERQNEFLKLLAQKHVPAWHNDTRRYFEKLSIEEQEKQKNRMITALSDLELEEDLKKEIANKMPDKMEDLMRIPGMEKDGVGEHAESILRIVNKSPILIGE